MSETVLTHARLVLADEVIAGTLVLRDGLIAAIDQGPSSVPGAQDMGGDVLMPGLIEVHTDNAEKHAVPRPGVVWPLVPAMLAHDAQLIAAGITTVYDAVSLGHDAGKEYRKDLGERLIEAIDQGLAHMRADHRLHLRCEVATPGCLAQFEGQCRHPRVGLVSLMDHTPGQRQFATIDKYREYYMGKYGIDAATMERMIHERLAEQARYAPPTRAAIAAWCRDAGITLASHDDATPAHVDEAFGEGATVSEFPTTREAAVAARSHGMMTIAGAPNVVRGGSHSGNVAALELAREGLADVLSSDYVPASLLHAAFRLTDDADLSLPAAVACVTQNPATLLGLQDRGVLRAGTRADVLRVHPLDHSPVVRAVWCQGQRML